MKALLMSIRPEWVAKILNGEKTIEIRKTIPKCDLPIDVYIYCTKGNNFYEFHRTNDKKWCKQLSGKVVAKFTLNKVEEIVYDYGGPYEMFQTGDLDCDMLNIGSCLTDNELKQYLKPKREHGNICGYAWHIDNLVIFDKPKDLNDFLIYSHTVSGVGFKGEEKQFNILKPLTRAPQSWCYIEE